MDNIFKKTISLLITYQCNLNCSYCYEKEQKLGYKHVYTPCVGTVDLYNGKLYIQTGKKKDVSKQIEKNPNVELCAFQDGIWVRVAGQLVNDDSREAKKHMLNNYPNLRGMYNEDDDNTQVLYFEDGVATIYSFTSQPKVIKL